LTRIIAVIVAPRKTSIDFSRGDAGCNGCAKNDDIRRKSPKDIQGGAIIDDLTANAVTPACALLGSMRCIGSAGGGD
jgi:hypothetical protein